MTPLRATLGALTLTLLSACGAARRGPDVVWPPAPEQPRIRFLSSFRGSSELGASGAERLVQLLTGADAAAQVGRPMGLALTADGARLYIADPGRQAVFVLDRRANALSRFAPDEEVGEPFGIAVDAEGNVYLTDTLERVVRVFSPAGRRLRTFGREAQLERPTGIAIDRARGRVYVADSATLASSRHRVVAFDLRGRHLRDLGKGRGSAPGELFFPVYLAVSAEGELHVADTMNFRVQVFTPEGEWSRVAGEHGDAPGTFARMKGMAFDGFGNLYVVDAEHSVVQLFNRDFQPLMFFGGDAPRVEYLQLPSAIAIDPSDNTIFVANELNGRINLYALFNTRAEDCLAEVSR